MFKKLSHLMLTLLCAGQRPQHAGETARPPLGPLARIWAETQQFDTPGADQGVLSPPRPESGLNRSNSIPQVRIGAFYLARRGGFATARRQRRGNAIARIECSFQTIRQALSSRTYLLRGHLSMRERKFDVNIRYS